MLILNWKTNKNHTTPDQMIKVIVELLVFDFSLKAEQDIFILILQYFNFIIHTY